MAIIKVQHEGSRLDALVLEHYGDLTMFDAVLIANPSIESVFLTVGVAVVMPLKTVKTVEDELW